jgi:hypothetical protein
VRLTIYSKPFVPKLQVFFKAHPKDSVGKITMFLNHLFCNKNPILFLCFFLFLCVCIPVFQTAVQPVIRWFPNGDVCSEDSMSTECKIVSCHVHKTFPMGQIPRKR